MVGIYIFGGLIVALVVGISIFALRGDKRTAATEKQEK